MYRKNLHNYDPANHGGLGCNYDNSNHGGLGCRKLELGRHNEASSWCSEEFGWHMKRRAWVRHHGRGNKANEESIKDPIDGVISIDQQPVLKELSPKQGQRILET